MTAQEQAAFAAGIQAAMTATVTIEVRDDAQELRQQAAAAALHGLAAGLKVAFPDPPPAPDAVPAMMAAIHVEDWQAWIADGLGIVTNGVLCVTGPELTADEWAARHVSEH